jgi:hypothetical protein
MFGMSKKTDGISVKNDLKEKAAGIISIKLEKIKTLLASRLSGFEQQLTTGQKKICLLIFCICMGSISVGLIVEGISIHDNKPSYLLQKGSIKTPLNTTLPDSLDLKWLKEMQKMKKAVKVLKDSLKK